MTVSTEKYKVADLGLAEKGRLRIDWAEARMPVLMQLREEFSKTKPLAGMRIAGCLHVTKETAVLIRDAGRGRRRDQLVRLQPALDAGRRRRRAGRGASPSTPGTAMNVDEFYWCIDRTLDFEATLTLDDGADLIFRVHSTHPEKIAHILGGTEETTTGVHRLRAMARTPASSATR
jgi:adenosylhomocysteinase